MSNDEAEESGCARFIRHWSLFPNLYLRERRCTFAMTTARAEQV
jgi:hypothetical protein